MQMMIQQSRQWVISRAEHGQSLLDNLAERLQLSRRQAKKLLDQRCVFVNQRRVWMARHVLHAGNAVEVYPWPRSRHGDLSILFENAHYVIANKPAGMPVDGSNGVEAALRRMRKASYAHARLVHRLDRDTSGCLLLAKTQEAFDRMIPLFQQRLVAKVYHALVLGRFPTDRREIRQAIDGKEAVTRVMLISANEKASHLRIRIETGRTHQIRKHLQMVRHPVLGDRHYGLGPLPDAHWRAVPRQMLHAAQLAFRDPVSGEAVRVRSPLPPDFLRELRKLNLH